MLRHVGDIAASRVLQVGKPGLVYMAGSERRSSVVVVFMEANRLGRNGMRRRVHREGLDGTADGNEA